jgi:hypothetical protein
MTPKKAATREYGDKKRRRAASAAFLFEKFGTKIPSQYIAFILAASCHL